MFRLAVVINSASHGACYKYIYIYYVIVYIHFLLLLLPLLLLLLLCGCCFDCSVVFVVVVVAVVAVVVLLDDGGGDCVAENLKVQYCCIACQAVDGDDQQEKHCLTGASWLHYYCWEDLQIVSAFSWCCSL